MMIYDLKLKLDGKKKQKYHKEIKLESENVVLQNRTCFTLSPTPI